MVSALAMLVATFYFDAARELVDIARTFIEEATKAQSATQDASLIGYAPSTER